MAWFYAGEFVPTRDRNIRYVKSIAKALPIWAHYRDRSMIPAKIFLDNLGIVGSRVDLSQSGAVVECGTWQGGMSAALVEFCGHDRRYCFFDSFQGMPPAKEIDGAAALSWQADVDSPYYRDNCRSSRATFEDTIGRTGINKSKVMVVQGFFEDTLPNVDVPDILVLRLDADWYDSTKVCLEKFWDKLLPGGLLLIDDYYMWDGCAQAVHDFLSERRLPDRIEQGRSGVAYIMKMK
jgi:O-methyltransferase